MKLFLYAGAAALALLGALARAEEGLPELAPSRQNYEAGLAKIRTERAQHLAAITRAYNERLAQLAPKMTVPVEARAWAAEKTRLEKGQSLGPEERRALPAPLLAERTAFEAQLTAETAASEQWETQTKAAWTQALKQWHDYFVKGNQNPKAELVQAEIDVLTRPAAVASTAPAAPSSGFGSRVAGGLAEAPAMPDLLPRSPSGKPAFFGTPVGPGQAALEPMTPASPALPAPATAPLMAGAIKVINTVGVPEAKEVLLSAQRNHGESLKGIQEVELVQVHDFAADPMKHKSGKAERMEGAHADQALVSSNGGIIIYGPYEKLEAGHYLVVYRVRFYEAPKDEACFLDVANKGVTVSGQHPKGAEVPLGQWHEFPLSLKVDHAKDFEYRLWGSQHRMAMDRVYIYRVRTES